MVGYVDYDPVAVAHSQALLAKGSRQIVAVDGDMADPEAILAHDGIRRAGFSLDAPACVILCCVLHFLDAATAKGVVSSLARSLAPGSYVIVSIGWGKGAGRPRVRQYLQRPGRPPDLRPHLGRHLGPVRRPGAGASRAWWTARPGGPTRRPPGGPASPR